MSVSPQSEPEKPDYQPDGTDYSASAAEPQDYGQSQGDAPSSPSYASGISSYDSGTSSCDSAAPSYDSGASSCDSSASSYSAGAQSYGSGASSYTAGAQSYRAAQADAPFGVDPVTGLPYSDKSKLVAGLLGIFLGSFGVGRFYTGHVGLGVAQLIVTFVTLGFGSLWGFIDGIIMLAGNPRDPQGRPLRTN